MPDPHFTTVFRCLVGTKDEVGQEQGITGVLKLATVETDKWHMIWFLRRHEQQVSYEIRRATGSGEGFELLVTNVDGSQRLEQFADADELIRRTVGFQRELLEAGWGSPEPGNEPSLDARHDSN